MKKYEDGFALLIILIVMLIIAALAFGSGFFSDKGSIETYDEIERGAEVQIEGIESAVKEKQKMINENRQ